MAVSQQRRATAEDAMREASRYIVHELGDRLWAGNPSFDRGQQRWKVPIHSRSLPADVVLGEIVLDSHAVILHGPSRRRLQRAIAQHGLRG